MKTNRRHKSSTQIKLDRALSERTLLQTRLLKFRATADLTHDEIIQTRRDQRQAPWERFSAFELKIQELEAKLAAWEEKIIDVEDRLIRLDEYCEELFALEESEREQYVCAIGASVLLTLLFAYDGLIMGFPQANFWTYLVLPHVLLAATVVGATWRKGMLHKYPVAYVLGFAALLVLTMVHRQNFLFHHNDWKAMSILLQRAAGPGNDAIEPRQDLWFNERWTALGFAARDYWHSFLNYTNFTATS